MIFCKIYGSKLVFLFILCFFHILFILIPLIEVLWVSCVAFRKPIFYRRDSRLIYDLGSYVLVNKNLKGQNAMYL